MQIPKRRSQLLKVQDDDAVVYLTPEGIRRLHEQLHDLEQNQRPQAIHDVSVAVAKGDLSENAEYTEAKARLGRIEGRLFSLKERLKKAVEIQKGPTDDGRIQMGSTVVVRVNGKDKTYTIVGPQETNPTYGRISHQSPLGVALLNKRVGEVAIVETPEQTIHYEILEVK